MWQFLKDNYMLVSLAVGLLGVVIAVISLTRRGGSISLLIFAGYGRKRIA